jgi:hypothetical protein
MPSDYEAIRTEHLRRYGDDVGNYGALLVDLYSDLTQFLLELLQNAQDARDSGAIRPSCRSARGQAQRTRFHRGRRARFLRHQAIDQGGRP